MNEEGLTPLTRALIAEMRAERAAQGLTQQQVYEAAGLSRSAYWNIEKERRQPSAEQIERIACALAFNPSALYKRAEKRLASSLSKPSNVVRMPDRFVIDDTVQAAFDAPKPSDYEKEEEDYSQDPDDYRK